MTDPQVQDEIVELTVAGYEQTGVTLAWLFHELGRNPHVERRIHKEVDSVLEVIGANCHSRKQFVNPMPPIMEPGEFYMPYPVEVEVGGATVFVIPVERFERL